MAIDYSADIDTSEINRLTRSDNQIDDTDILVPLADIQGILEDHVNGVRVFEKLKFQTETEVTIAGGSVTLTRNHHTVDTEADAASDDLDTINGVTEGQIYLLRAANAARTVVIKHGVDNITSVTGANLLLDDTDKQAIVIGKATGVTVGLIGGGGGTAGGGSKDKLSGSTNGRPIKIAATGTPGDTVHSAASLVQVFIDAINTDTANRQLTVEFGGTAVDDQIIAVIPAEAGLTRIVDGLVLQNSLLVRAFASLTNVVNVVGHVLTFNGSLLSGSTDGRMIKVTGTSSGASVTIHTAAASAEEIWLWATNTSGSTAKLTIEWGGATAPDDLIEVNVPAQKGLMMVVPGHVLDGSVAVKAWADTANVINIGGYVR